MRLRRNILKNLNRDQLLEEMDQEVEVIPLRVQLHNVQEMKILT